ncbi:MAG TPA: hypothetical protein VFD39_14800 [Trueperaceae bacterium]|nr:hypothetical protein [Trueperaceae bacterium]
MTDLEDILARAWTRVEGCRVVAIAGMDGLLIERHPNPSDEPAVYTGPQTEALEHLVADLTTLFGVTAGAMSTELGAPIAELIALGDNGGYYARRIDAELFCLLVAGAGAELENVRREAEALARELSVAFA